MSTPKRGLGRGLGALLGDAVPPALQTAEGAREVPVDRITPNRFQPRKHFDPQTLSELQRSIEIYGVLVPVIVRERGNGYELIAGERRWRASAALHKATIPAIVRRGDDRDSLEVAIVENLQRDNLNALEEAAGFAALIDEHGFTQEDVAQRVGKGRPTVTNALRLLALSDGVKAMIVDGSLSAGHARALLAAPEAARLPLAQRTARDGISVRQLERLCASLAAPAPAPHAKASPALTPEQRDFEARLREKLGARVALRRNARGGTIEIRYTDERDLMRLADELLGPGE